MALPLTDTCAGTDSDGKIWGIEGTNVLIILFGFLLSLGFLVLFWVKYEYISIFPILLGLIPGIIALSYVFFFRQGKPQGYDTDLMETWILGRGWAPDFSPRRPEASWRLTQAIPPRKEGGNLQ